MCRRQNLHAASHSSWRVRGHYHKHTDREKGKQSKTWRPQHVCTSQHASMLTLTYLPEGSFTFTSHASRCWHDSLCLSEFLVFREAFCATCGWQMPPLQGFLPNDPLTGWWLVKHNTVGFPPLLKHSWLACKVSGCVCVSVSCLSIPVGRPHHLQ